MAQLKPVKQYDFSKGENTVTAPHLLRPDQVQQALNFILDEHGSLRVRDGTLVDGAASPNAVRPIVKLWSLIQTGDVSNELAILAGINSTLPNAIYDRSTNPWTFIGEFTTYSLIPDIVNFTNLIIVANSNEEVLHSVSNGAMAALTGAPNGQHVANHLNYLWAWNTNPTTDTGSAISPSSLQASDLNNANSWPGANQTYISRDDGQTGQGLAQYTIAEAGISPTATLIAWKDFSGYECVNPFGSSFSVQRIKSDMGCVASRTIQFVSGFGIIRLTHRGFALYDGVNDTLISEEERPRIFGRDEYNGLDWAQIGHSQATQCANPPLYICACPTSGAPLTRVFVYDLVRRSWTVLNFTNPVGSLQIILDAGSLPAVLGGDWSGGRVRQYFNGATDDDGTAISWLLQTRAYNAESPSERTYWRRLLLNTFDFAGGTNITATFSFSPQMPMASKTITKAVPTVNAITPYLGFGLDQFGTSPFGAPTTTTNEDQVLEFPIGVKANSVQVQLTGSTQGRIRGIELHARPMPLTRSTYQGA